MPAGCAPRATLNLVNVQVQRSTVHGRMTQIKHGGLLNCSGPSMLTISLHRALNALKDSLQSASLKVYRELMLRLRLDVSIPKALRHGRHQRAPCQRLVDSDARTPGALLQAMPVSRTARLPTFVELKDVALLETARARSAEGHA